MDKLHYIVCIHTWKCVAQRSTKYPIRRSRSPAFEVGRYRQPAGNGDRPVMVTGRVMLAAPAVVQSGFDMKFFFGTQDLGTDLFSGVTDSRTLVIVHLEFNSAFQPSFFSLLFLFSLSHSFFFLGFLLLFLIPSQVRFTSLCPLSL